jgi:beta-N-acetylhexosaminidase
MTLEQKVGQVFVLGFEGTALNESNRALVHDRALGGVTLFGRNVENAAQVRQLAADLQSIAEPVPLFIAADQEGGLVVRITDGATVFPGNMALGAAGNPALAGEVARASASELLAMGINMDLASVVDVNTNQLNPVIGVRSFGSDVNLVSDMSRESVEGLQASGVSAVAKHFPGHGDTSVDSHRDLPVVPHPLSRLESLEFVPFEAALQAHVDGIMTGHLYLPAIEPQPDVPATISSTLLTGILRAQLGYQGLILTDAMDMAAIKQGRTAASAAVEAFQAGADMLLIAGTSADDRMHLADGPAALLAAVRSGNVSEERLNASVLRILQTKAARGVLTQALPAADDSVLNSPAHRALALHVARSAVTLQRDDVHLLPLDRSARVLVVVPDAPTRSLAQDDQLASSLVEGIREFAPLAVSTTPERAVDAAREADVVVFGAYDLAQDPAQQSTVAELAATGKPVIGVSLRGPYDAAVMPHIRTWLAVYGDRPIHLQAAAEALFGALAATGRAP